MKFDSDTVIFSITNGKEGYPEMAAVWASFLDKLNINNYIIYCLDKESFAYLNERGIGCELVRKDPKIKYKLFEEKEARFNERFGLIAAYKLMIAKDLLKQGKNIIFADTDALFCHNPIPLINRLLTQHDCLLSTDAPSHAHPKKIRDQMGFTLCSGFFVFKASPKAVNFISGLQEYLSHYSDLQARLNFYLWAYLTPRSERGCAYSFLGRGLSIKLLPQEVVRRTRDAETDSCIVHCTGRPKGVIPRASEIYKKLYGTTKGFPRK